LNIKIKYSSFNDDPLNDFYVPVLSKSILYKRAVGYFSSKILLDYTQGLKEFIKNSGTIQLIISPYLSNGDLNDLKSAIDTEQFHNDVEQMFKSYIYDNQVFASGKLLFVLLKMGKIDIKIAKPKNEIGLFHDKIGIFTDHQNNKIAIISSNKETSSAVKINIESFNTFCSWKPGLNEYVDQHEHDFDAYWNGDNPNIKLYSLEEALRKEIIELFDTDETLDELLIQVLEEESIENLERSEHINPRDYQIEAVKNWMENMRGIFKM